MGEGKERIGFIEGKGEPVLELLVRAAIFNSLKVVQINNSSIICLLLLSN